MKLSIKSKKNGFRRAGIAFSDTEATIVDTAKMAAADIEALMNDPGLLVIQMPGGKEKGEGGSANPDDISLLTVPVLKERLTALKVDFPPNAPKPELVKLLEGKLSETKE
jgi:hypothetical protein